MARATDLVRLRLLASKNEERFTKALAGAASEAGIEAVRPSDFMRADNLALQLTPAGQIKRKCPRKVYRSRSLRRNDGITCAVLPSKVAN